MGDLTEQLVATVAQAFADKTPLSISGGDSKVHILGRNTVSNSTDTLELSPHSGVVEYHPAELVITAKAGTPLTQINALLAAEGQILSFESPELSGRATLGGTLACNMSGPARPWGGSIRDNVLGVQLINGKGELLRFGGQVMKNVAGYDVSRLQAGAQGTLGVITQVSLKVLPAPEHSITLSYELDAAAAVALMNTKSAQAKPINGAYWVDGVLFLRLSGAKDAVVHTARLWGGELVADAADLWQNLREFNHPFFSGDEPLWRLSHKPNAPISGENGDLLIDWGGAQRWLRGARDHSALENLAEQAGGHATLFRGGNRCTEVQHQLSAIQKQLHQRVKHAFDPEGILNPGRLYSWM